MAVNDNRVKCIVQGCSITAVVILSVAISTNDELLNESAFYYSCLAGGVRGHGRKYIP